MCTEMNVEKNIFTEDEAFEERNGIMVEGRTGEEEVENQQKCQLKFSKFSAKVFVILCGFGKSCLLSLFAFLQLGKSYNARGEEG